MISYPIYTGVILSKACRGRKIFVYVIDFLAINFPLFPLSRKTDILQYCLDEERFTESEKRSTTMRSDFINKQDVLGLTPLHEAVMANNPNLVNCLLQTTNASTNIRDNKGQTAHDLAVKYRLHEIMQVFDIFSSDLDAAEAQAQAQAQGKNLVSNNNDNDDVTGMREMLRMKMGKRKAETVHTPGVLFPGRFFGLLE